MLAFAAVGEVMKRLVPILVILAVASPLLAQAPADPPTKRKVVKKQPTLEPTPPPPPIIIPPPPPKKP